MKGMGRELFNWGSVLSPSSHWGDSVGLGDTQHQAPKLRAEGAPSCARAQCAQLARKRFGLKEASSRMCKEGIKQGQAE